MGERYIAVLGEATGTSGGIRTSTAFTYHGLAIAYAALGRADEAQRAWTQSRELFRAVDHHALTAFTALNELRDLALTYGASNPTARRLLAAEAEAALRQAGGALRPGVSPRLAWLGCLVLDGRWDDALRILKDLPPPGNAYLRREVTAARSVLGRHRGESGLAWRQIRDLLPSGPVTAPGDIIHQQGLFLQRLAVDLCLDAGDLSGARAWLEAHDQWIAWGECLLGLAEGRLAWARYHRITGDGRQARSSASDALALASATDQPLVRLAAHRLLGEIESDAADQKGGERHLGEALALADACDAPFERALTLLALHLQTDGRRANPRSGRCAVGAACIGAGRPPRRAERARGRGAAAAGGRQVQRRDRRPALHHPAYRRHSRLAHPGEAGRNIADRSRDARRA
jgi:hypothetical protein